MKKIVVITLSLLLAVSFWNCEKDDICAEGTPVTPRLIIEFYDAANPTVLKSVTNLGVIEPTFTEGFGFTGVNKIQVPLRTTADITTLNFIQLLLTMKESMNMFLVLVAIKHYFI
jgi:hypothetical protein